MANKIEKYTNTSDDSSDDESLFDLKRKSLNNANNSNKRTKYDNGGDKSSEVLVNVPVDPLDINFDEGQFKKSSKSKKKKRERKKKSSNENYDGDSGPKRFQFRHKCGECTKSFTTAFSLRRHQMGHLRPPEKCPHCEIIFNFKQELKRHITTHGVTDIPTQFETVTILTEDGKHENLIKGSDGKIITPGKIKIEVNASGYETENLTGIINREQLTYLTQCSIVSKMHKGKSVDDICQLYNLTPEVVHEIWEDRNKFVLPNKDETKTVKYMYNVIDAKVIDWFNSQKVAENEVSNKMLQDIADTFGKECQFETFRGCKKWLDRFKKKYNINIGGDTQEDCNPGIVCKWKKQFFNETWCDVRVGYSNDDIYTADEVGLYYNASKGRIKKCGGKKFVQGHVKDRFSILMCANVTGTDKKKLLVLGTEDPLLHSYRDPDTLPVTYIRHSKAHFTTEIFEEYIKFWNRELQAMDRTILLVIDRAFTHSKLQLSNLKLVFVPWKASIGLIPIKNGIFRSMRCEFRKLLLEEKAMNVLRGVDRSVTCLEGLNMLEKAWNRVTPQVIYKSFEVIGYDIDECDFKPTKRLGIAENDEEIMCNLLKNYDVESYFTCLRDLDTYLMVDEEFLRARGALGEADAKSKGQILPIGTEKSQSDEDVVLRAKAIEDIELVRNYLQNNETSYEMFCSFLDVESFLLNCPINIVPNNVDS